MANFKKMLINMANSSIFVQYLQKRLRALYLPPQTGNDWPIV